MRRENLKYAVLDDSSNTVENASESKIVQNKAPMNTPLAPSSSSSSFPRVSNQVTEHIITESQSFDSLGPSSVIPSSFHFNHFPASLPRISNQTSRTPSATNTSTSVPNEQDVNRGIFCVMEEIDEDEKSYVLYPDNNPAHGNSLKQTTSSRNSTIYRRRSRRWRPHYNLRPSTSSSSSSTCSSTNSNCNTASSYWMSPLARRNDGFEEENMHFAISDPNILSSTTQVLKEADDETDESDTGLSHIPWKSPSLMYSKLYHHHQHVFGDVSDNLNEDSAHHSMSSEYPWLPPESKIHGAFTPFRFKTTGGIPGTQDDTNNIEGLSPISPCKPSTPTDTDKEDSRFKLHFETQYSPIPTVPDDYVRHSLTTISALNENTSTTTFDVNDKLDNHGQDRHFFFTHYEQSLRNESILSQPHSDISIDTQNEDTFNKSLDTSFMSNQSDTSSTSISKQRKNRPMPDMSAFDMGLSETTTTSASIQSSETIQNTNSAIVDGGVITGERRRPHSFGSNASRMSHGVGSNKWHCPPTPARTPAWAQGDGFKSLNRMDSLITTKVLAACPQHILDGLSSLETSFLEDGDHTRSTSGSIGSDLPQHTGSVYSNRDRSLMISFATVMEEDEADISSNSLNVYDARYDNQARSSDIKFTAVDNEDRSFLLAKRRISSPLDVPFDDESSSLKTAYTHSHKLIKSEKRLDEDYLKRSSAPRYNSSNSLSSYSSPTGSAVSFHKDFDVLAQLGSGSFADVFKARCKSDGHIYAIKRSRRRFRGKRDRDRNLAEVRIMQLLQTIPPKADGKTRTSHFCVYLLFFIRAWQEDAHFYCQTELCCRDSCRHLLLSLKSDFDVSPAAIPNIMENLQLQNPNENNNMSDTINEHLIPERTIWKICHDVSAGLCYIHSHNIVHLDIKPENIFFISHLRLGAICKIGDFGLARSIDTMDEGEEGDTAYMASELLVPSSMKNPKSCDIFSLGLALYELSSTSHFDLPLEGPRWHELRSGHHVPILPLSRSGNLKDMIQSMMSKCENRPLAENILSLENVATAGSAYDKFLRDYIHDIEVADTEKEKYISQMQLESRYTPTHLVRRTSGAASESSTRTSTPR